MAKKDGAKTTGGTIAGEAIKTAPSITTEANPETVLPAVATAAPETSLTRLKAALLETAARAPQEPTVTVETTNNNEGLSENMARATKKAKALHEQAENILRTAEARERTDLIKAHDDVYVTAEKISHPYHDNDGIALFSVRTILLGSATTFVLLLAVGTITALSVVAPLCFGLSALISGITYITNDKKAHTYATPKRAFNRDLRKLEESIKKLPEGQEKDLSAEFAKTAHIAFLLKSAEQVWRPESGISDIQKAAALLGLDEKETEALVVSYLAGEFKKSTRNNPIEQAEREVGTGIRALQRAVDAKIEQLKKPAPTPVS